MQLSTIDLILFFSFLVAVITLSLWASRRERSVEDYFLAGRSLNRWLISLSLIASNISTEHFVGMSGKGFELGLAIASFEWVAAIALVLVALVILPRFLRRGVFTIPQYFEYQYGASVRVIFAGYLLGAYLLGVMPGVLYSGGIALQSIFGWPLARGIWFIGIVAGLYTTYGGLKAVVWTDAIQGLTLLICGCVVLVLGLNQVGGLRPFIVENRDYLHMFLPASHPQLPWTIFLLGIWVPNVAYWGLNQFIVQRTLAAKSLKEGQQGILLAALIKLAIPFIVVFPGMIARQLYASAIDVPDQAYPVLLQHVLPVGLRGIMLAALFGAIMSSLDSMLNSTSTIFTVDIYHRLFRKAEGEANKDVLVGRVSTIIAVLFSCLWAPKLQGMGAVFDYIQLAWNAIWPGILVSFFGGMMAPQASRRAAVVAMVVTPAIYAALNTWLVQSFLNGAALTLLVASLCFYLVARYDRKNSGVHQASRQMEAKDSVPPQIDLQPYSGRHRWGAVICLATVILYGIFR